MGHGQEDVLRSRTVDSSEGTVNRSTEGSCGEKRPSGREPAPSGTGFIPNVSGPFLTTVHGRPWKSLLF